VNFRYDEGFSNKILIHIAMTMMVQFRLIFRIVRQPFTATIIKEQLQKINWFKTRGKEEREEDDKKGL